jgi:NhaP-type Na+/H+ or K+/H+ antiporter
MMTRSSALCPLMSPMRTAETGEPLLALAAVLLSYGLTQVAHGYGFLAVFACAMTLRSMERSADYHALMHEVIERLERLLTLIVLLLLGIALTNGLLGALSWRGAALGIVLLLVIRPVTGWIALRVGWHPKDRVGDRELDSRERLVTAFFGIRGIGSIFYLAYATGKGDFEGAETLWSTVAFVVAVSVVLHGVTATPIMRWLDDHRDAKTDPTPGDGEKPRQAG